MRAVRVISRDVNSAEGFHIGSKGLLVVAC